MRNRCGTDCGNRGAVRGQAGSRVARAYRAYRGPTARPFGSRYERVKTKEASSMTVDEIDNEYAQIRMIAIDLLDEILAEARDAQKGIGDEEEHQDAQGDALIALGDGHDP